MGHRLGRAADHPKLGLEGSELVTPGPRRLRTMTQRYTRCFAQATSLVQLACPTFGRR